MNNKLAIVVPCYNEEAVLPTSVSILLQTLQDLIDKEKIDKDSYLLFVNDGSYDQTWEILHDMSLHNKQIHAIKLSRNCGHQSALLAGLMAAKNDSDMTISIDADLQDDTSVIENMIDAYHQGCEIVYGVRNDRQTDSFFKKTTANLFYKFQSDLGIKTIPNHADFRLMSNRAIDLLSEYTETNLYLRGLIPLIGLKSTIVVYKRKKRLAGESKYPLNKMLALATDGITSFSIQPIRLVFKLGLTTIFICIATLIGFLIYNLIHPIRLSDIILPLSVWFIGGVQLTSIGIIGEYVGKIYTEVKHRPKYHIEQTLNTEQ